MRHVRIEMGEVVNGDVSPNRIHIDDIQFINDEVVAALFGHWIEYEDGSLRYRYQQGRRELVATFIEATVEDFQVADPFSPERKRAVLASMAADHTPEPVTKTLTLTPEKGASSGATGLRLGYVMNGKLITSTFVPISGQGVLKDLAAALPHFAAYLDAQAAE